MINIMIMINIININWNMKQFLSEIKFNDAQWWWFIGPQKAWHWAAILYILLCHLVVPILLKMLKLIEHKNSSIQIIKACSSRLHKASVQSWNQYLRHICCKTLLVSDFFWRTLDNHYICIEWYLGIEENLY